MLRTNKMLRVDTNIGARILRAGTLVLALALASVGGSYAQEQAFEYSVTPVKDGITMLHGAGGNIAVLESNKGLLVIDNGFEANSAALQDALSAFESTTQYVVNTHWHSDHVGANASLGETGTVFAHHNVRVRMAGETSAENFDALPVVTYEQGVTFNFADQTVNLIHLPEGHTDGDTVVHFKEANVFHPGDHVFAGWFPFIDKASGGSVDGYIRNVQAIIDMIDEETVVIPGHGPITDKVGLMTFKAMIEATRGEVAKLKASGLDLAAAQAQGLDPKWESWGTFFIKEDRWIATLWDDVQARTAPCA